jgi:hypothetical protein
MLPHHPDASEFPGKQPDRKSRKKYWLLMLSNLTLYLAIFTCLFNWLFN